MSGTLWSKEELKILKKHYCVLGTKVQQFLPNRSIEAIKSEAIRQRVKFGLFELGEEAFFDIETSQLDADFGYLFSYYLKTKGKEEYFYNVITQKDIHSGNLDKRLILQLIKDLKRYKRIYTYYGTNFDLAFCRTRALAHGYDFIPYGLIQHQDLYYLVRNKMKLSRNRLDNICNILGIEGKTHLEPKIWVQANTGNKEALSYILEHNKQDVIVLEKVYNKIKEYASITRGSI